MNWEQLLSTRRSRQSGSRSKEKNSTDLRSEFEKDYHRIIGSASFRRLQDKTQVFPLDKSDFIRTRLTHSLEVSSFGKSLGQNIGENILAYHRDPSFTRQMKEDICNILQCAGLIHDIGNPPFGHFGEVAIREWFEENLSKSLFRGCPISEVLDAQMLGDFYHFEGNAQAFRLVTKLHYLVDEQGMNLTYGLLNTIVKYPISSTEINAKTGNIKDKKMGFYFADQHMFEEITKETGTEGRRHPLTFILEAADDIAYKTADIEDAFVKGFLSYHQIRQELGSVPKSKEAGRFDARAVLDKCYQRGVEKGVKNPEEYAVKNWIVQVQGYLIYCATFGFTTNYETIMSGTYRYDLFHGTFCEELMELLGSLAYREVFTSDAIYKMEVSESAIMNFLMDHFVKAAIKYDDEDVKLSSIDKRMISFISSNYKNAYHYHAEGKSDIEKLYLRLLLVTDYICGMTDSYAKRLYQELRGIAEL
ncbi:deoxyguanosinetriphosphate triphosphohydrolase [Lachnospiraceae bacterium OttesenSCG-928-E19]|nr:deoxyguanosinetriphosphate triphosphohydrolase [Lachnospiraceae bacterium OttesenSCG-928-E19]